MFEALEDCLTCRRKTDSFFRISDPSNGEDIGTVVASHFWFQVDQYGNRVLCTSCWEKIDDFHKFYCEVKQLWEQEGLSASADVIKTEQKIKEDEELEEQLAFLVQVEMSKDESLGKSDHVDHPQDVKKDVQEDEDDPMVDDVAQEDSEVTDGSEEDSMVPIAKRRRSVKEKAKKPRTSKGDKPKKSRASKGDKSTRRTRNISSQQESNDKQTSKTNKKDEPSFKCDLCDPVKLFKKEEGLQLHTMMSHSEGLEKKYQCDQCEKAFAFEWQLSAHESWHRKESLNFHCDKCNRRFPTLRTLNNHTRTNHPEDVTVSSDLAAMDQSVNGEMDKPPTVSANAPKKTWIRLLTPEQHAEQDDLIRQYCTLMCDKCEFVAEVFKTLLVHYKTEHKVHGYGLCCGKKYFKKGQLFEHCQWHGNPDKFRCETCEKSFTDRESLERHNVWLHTPDSAKPFKCEICDASFKKAHLLLPHMKYHLNKEQKLIKCPDCDKSFGAANFLQVHRESVHGAASSWVCDICAKGFPYKSLLVAHRLAHSEEGAASLKKQCEHCKKWLVNKKKYQLHLKVCVASGQASGPVSCDLCGKEVANQPALVIHKRFYHTERPIFTCSYCGKQFKRVIRHKEHEANHRGELLYSCEFCTYSCNSNSNMYTHKKTAHKELWAAKVASRFQK